MSSLPDGIRVRWIGHGTFDLNSPSGQRLLVDPFLKNNPVVPPELAATCFKPGAYQAILITHPHGDHFEDALPLLLGDPALKVICQFEVGGWLKSEGVKEEQIIGMNTGGTLPFGDIRITMVPAIHTSSVTDKNGTRALGFPAGFVLRFANGFCIYAAGDTAVSMEMQVIHDLYHPDLVILPIGDFYTMGPEQAAYALHLLKPKLALGIHWGTWQGKPPGTPEALEKELARYRLTTQLIKLKPGETLA
jgi:L-ascorbate metabolism protein UlaG (beta-lactamase superfamily)